MSGIIEEKMKEIKRVYEQAMADVDKFRALAVKELNEYKKRVEDEIEITFSNINPKVDSDRHNAANYKKNVYIPPPREAPPPKRVYKYNKSQENNEKDYYYNVLGVTRTASTELISQGYNNKKMLYNPNNTSDNLKLTLKERENMFIVIYRAYMLLALPENEKLKKMYDKQGNTTGWVQQLSMQSSINPRDYKYHEWDAWYMKDYYYKVLGVTNTASIKEIIKAYHKQSLLYHPDKKNDFMNQKEQITMFSEINRAYRLLSKEENQKSRTKYDKNGNKEGWVKTIIKSRYDQSEYNPYIVIQ